MYLKLLITILIPFLLGILGISAILRERLAFFTHFERLAIAFAAGVWILVLIMFGFPFINIPLTFQNILFASFALLIGLTPFSLKYLKHFLPKSYPKKKNFLIYLLLFLIAVKVLFVFWSALLKPAIDPDIIKAYALAAKQTFHTKVPHYSGDKPPLPFLIESWPTLSLETWNDTLLPLFYPLMFISLLVIFYSCLNRYFSEIYALFFTFLLASIPFLLFHAGTAYTDFPQAFYYSIATIYLFQFFKEFPAFSRNCRAPAQECWAFLFISMIFLGISVWVKKSGLYYAGINFSALGLSLALQWKSLNKRDWKALVYAVLLFVAIVSPWLAYHKFVTLKGYYGQLVPSVTMMLSQPTPEMSLVIISAMLRNMFLEGNWQLLWMLFFSLLVLYPKKIFSAPRAFMVSIIILQLMALFILFRFTDQFCYILNDTLINRLTLHFVPVVFYFCAEVIASRGKR